MMIHKEKLLDLEHPHFVEKIGRLCGANKGSVSNDWTHINCKDCWKIRKSSLHKNPTPHFKGYILNL